MTIINSQYRNHCVVHVEIVGFAGLVSKQTLEDVKGYWSRDAVLAEPEPLECITSIS